MSSTALQHADRPAWPLRCRVNGAPVSEPADPCMTLLDFLRSRLLLTGTKGACLEGECGSCTVLVDGCPINSCLTLVGQMQDRSIVTIEGLADGDVLDVMQQKFVETGAAQCGYCTPGLIMSARALLDEKPDISEAELLQGMEGNICRCTGYNAIVQAIRLAYRETHECH